mmetsp:Transcript_17652/g.36299  ORF Transcript_17652/g.36299 Transcript_17652/m.36299 type:complete len:111 (-) Transcript_17652:661-993(-)
MLYHVSTAKALEIADIEIPIASAHIAVGSQFHHLSLWYLQATIVGIHFVEPIGMKGVLNEFVVKISFPFDRPRELVVIDAKGFKPPIPDRVVAFRQRPLEFVVIQMKMAQ